MIKRTTQVRQSILIVMCFVASAWMSKADAQAYSLVDLGPGAAFAINNAGEVAGFTPNAVNSEQATLWDGKTPTYLNSLGGSLSVATSINDYGVVAGYAGISGNVTQYGTTWIGPNPVNLGALGGGPTQLYDFTSNAYGINNSGQVVGIALNPSNTPRATLWNGSVATDLGTLGGSQSSANAINNSGQIVGWAAVAGNTTIHATLWQGASITDLGTLGGSTSWAFAISNSGVVAGMSGTAGNTSDQAVIWRGQSIIALPTLGGDYSYADGVNDYGLAVGASNGHAALWNGTSVFDLNSTLSDSLALYVTLTQATAINDLGWIAAVGFDSRSGQQDAYVLVPVPIISPACLFLSGLLALSTPFFRRTTQQARTGQL